MTGTVPNYDVLAPIVAGVLRIHGAAGPDDPLIAVAADGGYGVPAGACLSIDGAVGRATLAAFSIAASGDFIVEIAAGNLTIAGGRCFALDVTSAAVQRSAGTTTLHVRSATARLFPGAPHALTVTVTNLDVAATGAFQCDLGQRTIEVPQLLRATGHLGFGIELRKAPVPFGRLLSYTSTPGTMPTPGFDVPAIQFGAIGSSTP